MLAYLRCISIKELKLKKDTSLKVLVYIYKVYIIQNDMLLIYLQKLTNSIQDCGGLMPIFPHLDPQLYIKILDFTYTSEPSINAALPLKLNKIKFVIFTLLCIVTLGFAWLIAKWSARKKAIMIYDVCSIAEATHFLIQEEDASADTSIIQRTNRLDIKRRQHVVSFLYHDRNFLYHQQKQVFLPIRYQDLGLQLDRLKKSRFEPYSRRTRKKLLQYYGLNEIILNVQSYIEVFVQQMLTPYEVFQLYAIILWLSQEYYVFPAILLVYSIYTYWDTAKEIVKNQRKLSQRSYFNMSCKVVSKKKQKIQRTSSQIQAQNQLQMQANDSQDYTIVDDHHIQQIIQMNNIHQHENVYDGKMQSQQIENKNSGFVSSSLDKQSQLSNMKSHDNTKTTIQVTQIQSKEILPGDIIILREGDVLPCDCILISGQAIIDQSYITGQNYLIRKVQLNNLQYLKDLQKTFLLYLGTKIVKVKDYYNQPWKLSDSLIQRSKQQIRQDQLSKQLGAKVNLNQNIPFALGSNLLLKDVLQQKQIACLVTQTNYNTQRGKYLRAIRYQKKPSNNFTRQSIYFIYIIIFITVFMFSIIIPYIRQHVSKSKMLYLFVDLLATSIPITLPTALSVGINFAQHRLNKCKINSILPSNILSGGRATTILLDSNRILSKNYEVASIVVGTKGNSIGNTYSNLSQFLDLTNTISLSQSFMMQDPQNKKQMINKMHLNGKMLIRAFSTCHSLERYNNQLSGTAQQRHLYQFAKAKYLDDDQYQCLNQNLRVKQRIYFKQKLKKMAVIVQIHKSSKGYIQSGKQFLRQQTLNNSNFQQGPLVGSKKRVSISQKQKIIFIKGPPDVITKICKKQSYPANYHEYIVDLAEKGFKTICFAYKRYEQNFNIEKNIFDLSHDFVFCGFALLQTQKQHDTIKTITELKQASMQVILISEESSLVASSLAINNKLCNKNELLLCSMSNGRVQCTGHLEWQSGGEGNDLNELIVQSDALFKNSYLSINSKLYEQLFMKREQKAADFIFKKSIIYNQMENRHSRNVYLQLDKRKKVTFAVGSGVNVSQCAHLSIELQRGQCSMLSSFHTSEKSLNCITNCLIICRAALATNFHCFSMMILFSLIQFSTVSMLYFHFHTLSDFQMLYQDLIVTFPIFVTINLTSPAQKLSKQLPQKSFFSFRPLASMIGQFLIQLITQITFVWYISSLEFMQVDLKRVQKQFIETSNFGTSSLNLATFVLTNYLYLGIVLSTSVSKPFRKPFYTNIFYTLTLVVLWLYNTAIVLFPQIVPNKLRKEDLTQEVQQTLVLSMLLGNLIMIVMYVYENCIIWINVLIQKVKVTKSTINQLQVSTLKQQR